MARSRLYRTDLYGRADRRFDRMVHGLAGAAGTARQPIEFAESLESAVVFPRAAGNARVLRSVAGRGRVSGPHHRRAHGDSIYRHEPERKRLLHAQRPSMGNHDIPAWIFDSLDSPRDS